MSWLLATVSASIGKKQCMALSGLALCGFLVVHLLGNFLVFLGPEKFNGYAHFLETHPLLIPAEIGLAFLFLVHIGLAARVTRQNWAARPHGYAVKATEGGRSLASGTMWLSGLITLVFLVLHLIHFKFAADEEKGDLHKLVLTTFHSLPYVVWYVFAVCVLGLHVGHGLKSAFRSLGLEHPKYTLALLWLSRLFGVAIAIGYASIPIWAYFFTRTLA